MGPLPRLRPADGRLDQKKRGEARYSACMDLTCAGLQLFAGSPRLPVISADEMDQDQELFCTEHIAPRYTKTRTMTNIASSNYEILLTKTAPLCNNLLMLKCLCNWHSIRKPR